MTLEHAILGFLSSRPRSGYELKTRCFDIEAKAFWTADQAQIYRTLERLRGSRMVGVATRRQSGRPDRKVYSITASGRTELERWETSPASLPPARDEFLLQVYFSGDFPDDVITGLLEGRRAYHQARLEELRAEAIEHAKDASRPARTAAMQQAAFDGAIALERASIDWLDYTLEAIETGHLPSAEKSANQVFDPLLGTAPA